MYVLLGMAACVMSQPECYVALDAASDCML
jgi:hypothetical protein